MPKFKRQKPRQPFMRSAGSASSSSQGAVYVAVPPWREGRMRIAGGATGQAMQNITLSSTAKYILNMGARARITEACLM